MCIGGLGTSPESDRAGAASGTGLDISSAKGEITPFVVAGWCGQRRSKSARFAAATLKESRNAGQRHQSPAAAINSAALNPSATATRMSEAMPGFCCPRSIELIYARSIPLRKASSSCDTPRSTRARRIAAPSATKSGSLACRGDDAGIPRYLRLADDHTTDDFPHAYNDLIGTQ